MSNLYGYDAALVAEEVSLQDSMTSSCKASFEALVKLNPELSVFVCYSDILETYGGLPRRVGYA